VEGMTSISSDSFSSSNVRGEPKTNRRTGRCRKVYVYFRDRTTACAPWMLLTMVHNIENVAGLVSKNSSIVEPRHCTCRARGVQRPRWSDHENRV
jgi:hypothetical protein